MQESRADLALTPAKRAMTVKWRSLHLYWRILSGPPDGNAQDRREHFRDVVYNVTMTNCSRKTSKSADWFKPHSELTPVIEAKRNILTAYKANSSEQNLQILRAARSEVQQCARQCANDYWLQLCSQIQIAADTCNIKAMYDDIKQALDPTQSKTAPLKSATSKVIQDREKTDGALCRSENVATEEALNDIEYLQELEESDREPTIDELREALDSLASGKAPGKDGIPAEALKCCKETLITKLHEILCLCWSEVEVSQDMRDANVVTMYKNKGDRSDCNTYRGISLLGIVGKVFARVVLKRLQVLADQVYPESQ